MKVGAFDFPDDLRIDAEHDTWARDAGDGTVVVGITSLGVRLSGEIYMCRPRPVGTEVERHRAIAVVELAKAIVSVRSPVGGTVVEINAALASAPERVHEDPYGEGWIARLRPASPLASTAGLLAGEALAGAMRERIRLERLEDA